MIKLKSLFRRGPGPSGSKNSASGSTGSSGSQLKGAASVSSLDTTIETPIAKPGKQHHGSKDRLFKGSRDKLAVSRESLDVKELKHQRQLQQQLQQQQQAAAFQQQQQLQQQLQQQQQQLRQMPLIQQQHGGNNNLIDQRDVGGYSVDPLTKELTEINFDGPREVSSIYIFFFNRISF